MMGRMGTGSHESNLRKLESKRGKR